MSHWFKVRLHVCLCVCVRACICVMVMCIYLLNALNGTRHCNFLVFKIRLVVHQLFCLLKRFVDIYNIVSMQFIVSWHILNSYRHNMKPGVKISVMPYTLKSYSMYTQATLFSLKSLSVYDSLCGTICSGSRTA